MLPHFLFPVQVDAKDNSTNRCDECQKEYNNYCRRQRYYRKLFIQGNIFEYENCFYSSKSNKYDMDKEGYYLLKVTDADKPCRQFDRILHFERYDGENGLISFGKKINFDF